ncbi:glycoside hydrolase family 92 protein [Pedobacter sp. HMWF019]|uniref:GH92 family glycosyl hydrolase n=1 Tax=Pedobacter sp. HMWF019 TaxID=2056856 RepID=UPI000D3BCD56|nr:GH92 family glycosyl hydrolase [Pedobacter sp. HMWF019]PTT01072.1 glycoside hydrolase family 92 protein [Pedobacter sp. HMWF019]
MFKLVTYQGIKLNRFCLLFFAFLSVNSIVFAQQKMPVDYVNPFIGASTNMKSAGNPAGLGKTFPGATTPFGMTQVSPNTITGGDNGSGYSYEHKSIEGFALTQMSGIGWYGDLGNFLVMPTVGKLKTAAGKEGVPGGYRSYYDKRTEKATAGYYSVVLSDEKITAELSATPHCGIMRFTFPENKQSRIQIDLARRVGGTATKEYVQVVDDYTIQGWIECTPEGGGWGNGQGKVGYTLYFYSKFSKPLKKYGIWSADIPDSWVRKGEEVQSEAYQQAVARANVTEGLKEKEGKHIGFYTEFPSLKDERVIVKTGISYVSLKGAQLNLQREIKDLDFDLVHKKARILWNKELSKMTVKGGSEESKYSFYTALYHTLIDPRTFQDVDGKYPGGDGKIHVGEKFTKRTIFSGWDVFRSQMPLQTLINPDVISDLINSQVSLATENKSGYYDRWEILNAYSGCMVGNPTLPVIADAVHKGIQNFDMDKAYQYALNTSAKFGNGDKGFSGPPYGISNTLEYAYDDWCIAQMARSIRRKADEVLFLKKAQAYRNIFDADKGWFRPRKENGDWELWPEKGRLQDDYGTAESNPYQQGWFVPHDIPGLADLLGGKTKAVEDLTAFFEHTPENLLWNDYYNHANEPVHHVAYMFNRLGAPWLTQRWVHSIAKNAYHNAVEGLVGNDDVGQMSAWYVLAATGIAQICPGDNRYEISSPVFDQVQIKLSAGSGPAKFFTISALKNSPEHVYIQSAKLNGKPYNKSYLNYADINSGAVLELVMGNTPNKTWGIEE